MYIERDSRQTHNTTDGDTRVGTEYLSSCLNILSDCIVQAIPLLMGTVIIQYLLFSFFSMHV